MSYSSSSKTRPGVVLREFRLSNGWTLGDVHSMTGISVSTLSKIETGKVDPHYTKLMLLSDKLGLDIANLIAAPQATAPQVPSAVHEDVRQPLMLGRRAITRAGDETRRDDPNYSFRMHAADLLQRSLHPMVLTIKARSRQEFGELMRHSGEEFAYVLEGEVEFCSEQYAPVRLSVGDSIYFDAEMGHCWIAVAEGQCTILTVFNNTRQ